MSSRPKKQNIRGPTPAQRAAQSKRDKAAAGIPSAPRVARPPKPSSAMMNANSQVGVAAAYATTQTSKAPKISGSRDQCRIVHRELISSVTGSAAFTVQNSFALNPGLAATFPWLSTQAINWESYRFNKLRFCAYTRCATSVPGSLMLAPDYDAADSAPASEQIASSYEDVEEDVPWKDVCVELRPAAMFSLGPKKFIRTGALSANQDIKTYDAGNLHVCTVDGTAVNWSKLWVEYDVTLYTPQVQSGGTLITSNLHTQSATAPTSASPFGATVTTVATSNSPVNLPIAGGNSLTFNKSGRFLVLYNAVAATSVTLAAGWQVTGAGATMVATYGTSGVTVVNSGGTQYSTSCLVDVNVNLATPGVNLAGVAIVAGTSAELFVIQVPSTQG